MPKQENAIKPETTAMEPINNPYLRENLAAAERKSKVLILQVPRQKGDLLTNFSQGNEEDEVEVSRAMSPCDANLDAYVGKIIVVVGAVLNMTEFESQEVKGEMVDKCYCSIILADGSVVGTTSRQPMNQLAYFIGTRPPGRFDPPMAFEVRQHKSPPPKKPYYSLRRVAEPTKAPKKGINNAV